jgi:hypothetical protein
MADHNMRAGHTRHKRFYMEDIICTVPWHCGDKDCEAGWHKADYWIYSDGSYTVSNYADGDHDPVEEGEVPTFKEENEAWLSYYDHVATTGEDPLRDFMLPSSKSKTRKWQAQIRNWIGASEHGLCVVAVRRRGRGPWVPVGEAPIYVKDFLFVGHPQYKLGNPDIKGCRSSIGPDLMSMDDLVNSANGTVRVGKFGATILFAVEEPGREMNEEKTREYLRRAGRRAVRELKGRTR